MCVFIIVFCDLLLYSCFKEIKFYDDNRFFVKEFCYNFIYKCL